jgi:hypothetical protein
MTSALHREDREKRPPPESSGERRARVTGFSIQLTPTPECLRRSGMTRTGWPTLNPASVAGTVMRAVVTATVVVVENLLCRYSFGMDNMMALPGRAAWRRAAWSVPWQALPMNWMFGT